MLFIILPANLYLLMMKRKRGGERESERNVIWTNTVFIRVHMLGRHAAAAPRRHPQSAWPASPGLGLPTHPQESGPRGEAEGAPGELSDLRDQRKPRASCFFKPMSHVLSLALGRLRSRERGEWGARRVGWAWRGRAWRRTSKTAAQLVCISPN